MTKPTLSMIVRDAAESLRPCLESVRGVVDEIVIADTGSQDSTVAIARECGARVIEIPWENDFSAARNRALAAVRGGWVLCLDADEVLDPAAASIIPTLLADTEAAGYQVPIRNYVLSLEDRIWDMPAKPNDFHLPAANEYPAFVDHENVRLFRRDAEIYFVGRVHESVGSQIEHTGRKLARANFIIHHFGLAADLETKARKNRFYRELGKLKIQEMPDNAQAYLELGLVELDAFGNLGEALDCFERACALKPRLGVAWFFAGLVHFKLKHHRDALRCLRQAEEKGHATSFVAETIGDAYYNEGKFPQAVRAYHKALKMSPDSLLLESKLGLGIVRAGAVDKGLEFVRRSVDKQPLQGELHDRLILSLVWLNRISDAALAAENKLRAVPTPLPSDFLRSASLWAKLARWERATAVLHVGLQLFPADALLTQAVQEICVQQGTKADDLIMSLNSQGAMVTGN